VKLPARGAQRLAIVGVALELGAIFEDGVEHFGRLDQENLEELGVEPVGVGREQPLRLGRQRWSRFGHRRAALRDSGDGGLQRDGAAAVDLRQRLELSQCPAWTTSSSHR
jgi:hypothetical protein